MLQVENMKSAQTGKPVVDQFFITVDSAVGHIHMFQSYVSVPSFGDSFFMYFITDFGCVFPPVSVPSFGDSFFIRKNGLDITEDLVGFPSPHSGILFLS